MEQIAGYKQEIRFRLPCLSHNLGKGILNGLGSLSGPGFITVRSHTPVDIGSVDKFHLVPPSIM